jgi:hypothetical protein
MKKKVQKSQNYLTTKLQELQELHFKPLITL